LNGAANICYRDLELFGLGVLNLRQPLNSKTYEPIVKDVHYVEFINDDLVNKILAKENIDLIINDKVEELLEFSMTNQCNDMIEESKKWFINNCLPKNQFKIIVSFLDDFNIFL